ncbi:UDP-2,3-diacylglucosamine diphosphatase [Campylobacter sp. VicNov18]|nr:UDP-2,3-diacylglucosamine diphosphatase [Campylobacter bilis]MPV63246.1 UDP-2,3-diacylglucosamine diphosphatase [Campylobacter hepaticus]MBM0636745.1 UDP-2,3-diacylglucosamine diphosphatase [Campylobacter bilis]MCC8277317.1 UDP-2,3-diacylglucosamine diphosphatase [Campylobacter bilis]MCC8299060.1 UDP-2,3-diacylglucosamine diphosphatase [Campylobacter bilis]MCC8300226.1 UDP-2,3-diacylglucosamine diphosphatase [Campylobacter bilis]
MGDIFDLLVGEISATHEFAKPYINILEELALNTQILYLEGNHDFNLTPLFQRVKIFTLEQQPLKLNLHPSKANNPINNNTIIHLAHGDIFLSPLLQFILKSLRNHYLLIFLNFLNTLTYNFISKTILKNQKKKNLFYKIKDFENLAKERYKKYGNSDSWVCEGHYHQNMILNQKDVKYFNLASFAHEKSFFVVKYQRKIKFQEQKLRGQNV